MKRLFVAALLSLSVLSCVSTATTMLNPGSRHRAVTPDKVVIYTSASKIAGKYEEIALLTSQGDYMVAGDDKFYESFRREAAKIGANGVIISQIEDPTTGQKVGSAILGAFLIPTTMANRKTQAMAIYVVTPEDEAAKVQEVADAAARIQRRESLDAVVKTGMTIQDVERIVGPATRADAVITGPKTVDVRWTYETTSGQTFLVLFSKGAVVSVTKK